MSAWPIQDAKARFSELLQKCLSDGPQIVTRRGMEAAVLVPVEQWRQIQAANQPSLKELLLSRQATSAALVPSRKQQHSKRTTKRRAVPAF
jgi:antitoxin Phd